MIKFENISKSYASEILFSNVNISIKRGMRAGLVGKNGSGKTTLLKLMLGDENPDTGKIFKEQSLTIGYLPQDIVIGTDKSILEEVLDAFPKAQELEKKITLLSNSIAHQPDNKELIHLLGEAQGQFDAIGGWGIEKNAKKILSGLGFSEKEFSKAMETFSGGWRMRVALASILIQNPDVLFLDEPTNHLDLEATIWLENFLNEWKGGLIVISHDRIFLDNAINYIIDIDLKQVTLFLGTYSEFVKNKKIILEQHRNAYKNQQKVIKQTERFIERFRYKNTKAVQVQSRIKNLEKMDKIEMPIEDRSSITLNIPQPDRSPQKLVTSINVSKNYGDLIVFKDLNFIVERNQKVALVGKNGAGKSTILKMLAGVESVTNGSIDYGPGVNVGYYAQHQLEILNENDTVFDSVNKINNVFSENEIRSYLGGFLFSGKAIEKHVKILSGGEKARLALARMLIEPSNILLLDEPTNHLDMLSRSIIEKALLEFNGCIVCISHDRHFLNKVTNITYEVGVLDGVKIYNGNYAYYNWKKKREKEEVNTKVLVVDGKARKTYENRKKSRNKIARINKRFRMIENELEQLESILSDVKNISNAVLLQDTVDKINVLENEYMDLIEEKEKINL